MISNVFLLFDAIKTEAQGLEEVGFATLKPDLQKNVGMQYHISIK